MSEVDTMQIKSAPRRRHAAELKARVLAACDEPGASVAAIARAHALNANLVHKWRRGVAPPARPPASSSAGQVAGEFIALALPSREIVPAALADIRIELRRGATSVAVSWPLAAADQCAAWLRHWLR
jgi:transposase